MPISDLGQYFTTSKYLQDFVFKLVKFKGSHLLEPSVGAGHLLIPFLKYDPNYPMTCFEIDDCISMVVDFSDEQQLIYDDFTRQMVGMLYRTIIANPPFKKQSGSKNLYITFVELCYHSLSDGGEMIFIVPSDFIKQTHAAKILLEMDKNGVFTDFLFPHNERLFDGASIDVMIFRYEKCGNTHQKKTNVNGETVCYNVDRGIITFGQYGTILIDSLFDIYVGIVSGMDSVFKSPHGNISVLIGENMEEKFIFLESGQYDTASHYIKDHLLNHKTKLLSRRIRKFSEHNWFEWGAPRNLTKIRAAWGKECIFMRTITRQNTAFIGHVQYFSGSLLCLIPKKQIDLQNLTEYFNSEQFRKNYTYAGRFKIGHKQISSEKYPFD